MGAPKAMRVRTSSVKYWARRAMSINLPWAVSLRIREVSSTMRSSISASRERGCPCRSTGTGTAESMSTMGGTCFWNEHGGKARQSIEDVPLE